MKDRQHLAYGIDEACAAANVCRDKLYGAIREGLLVARKYGRRTLILEDDLESLPPVAAAPGSERRSVVSRACGGVPANVMPSSSKYVGSKMWHNNISQ